MFYVYRSLDVLELAGERVENAALSKSAKEILADILIGAISAQHMKFGSY